MLTRCLLAARCCMAWREADSSLSALVLQLFEPRRAGGEQKINPASVLNTLAKPQPAPQLAFTRT